MSFVKTSPGTTPIIVEASFSVPPSRVFEAWTNPEHIRQWFGTVPGAVDTAEIELTPGGRWRFVEAKTDEGTVGFEGSYLEIEPERRLVFSWTKFTEHRNGDESVTAPSRVEITFTATEQGTDMRITHSNVDPASSGFAIGWNAGIANLVDLIES